MILATVLNVVLRLLVGVEKEIQQLDDFKGLWNRYTRIHREVVKLRKENKLLKKKLKERDDV